MSIEEELLAALLLSSPEDLRAVRHYIGWMRFRRQVNDKFYPSRHWVKSARRYHWVGE